MIEWGIAEIFYRSDSVLTVVTKYDIICHVESVGSDSMISTDDNRRVRLSTDTAKVGREVDVLTFVEFIQQRRVI